MWCITSQIVLSGPYTIFPCFVPLLLCIYACAYSSTVNIYLPTLRSCFQRAINRRVGKYPALFYMLTSPNKLGLFFSKLHYDRAKHFVLLPSNSWYFFNGLGLLNLCGTDYFSYFLLLRRFTLSDRVQLSKKKKNDSAPLPYFFSEA